MMGVLRATGVRGASLVAIVATSAAGGAALTAMALRVAGDQAPAAILVIALVPACAIAIVARPLVGVLAVLAVLPVGSVQLPTPGLSFRLVELTVAAVAAVVMLQRAARGLTPLVVAAPLGWALGLFVWTVVVTPSALDLTLALKQVLLLALGILFGFVVLTALTGIDEVRTMLGVLVGIGFILSILALAQGAHFRTVQGAETVSGRLQGAFDHPNQLGGFMVICAALAAGLAFGAKTKTGRRAAALSLAAILPALVLTLSRGAWIGSGLAFLYLLYALPAARRGFIVVGIPVVAIALFVGSFGPGSTEITVVSQRVNVLTKLSRYDNRHSIYQEAEREIAARPLTGYGPGNFPVASVRADSAAATVYADHAHDLWLTWAAEAGVPAAVLILAFVISLATVSRRLLRLTATRSAQRDRAVIAGLIASLIAVLGQGIFDYLLRNAVLFMTVWALIGALLVCARTYEGDSATDREQT